MLLSSTAFFLFLSFSFFLSFFCFLFLFVCVLLFFSESRCGCGPFNYHLGPGRSDRLLQAIYEFGDLHHDKKATEVQAGGFLLPRSFGLWNLDVHCVCLHWSECRPFPGQPLQPLRMAQWRVWGRAGPDNQWPVQWVWNIQQLVVLPGSLHAARMWHLPQVSQLFSASLLSVIFFLVKAKCWKSKS